MHHIERGLTWSNKLWFVGSAFRINTEISVGLISIIWTETICSPYHYYYVCMNIIVLPNVTAYAYTNRRGLNKSCLNLTMNHLLSYEYICLKLINLFDYPLKSLFVSVLAHSRKQFCSNSLVVLEAHWSTPFNNNM